MEAEISVNVADPTGTYTGRGSIPLTRRQGLQVGISVNPAVSAFWFSTFPQAQYTRVFFGPGAGAPDWTRPALTSLPPTVARVGVSWKDQVPAAQIVAFVDAIPDGRHLDLTWRHEPEPNWPLAEYRAGWAELADALDGHPNRDRVRLVNIHTLWASRHKTVQVDWRRWMLPEYADVEGWDCYRDTSFDSYEPPESLFGLPYLSSLEFGTRWCAPEFGGTLCRWDMSGTARSRWFLECANFARLHDCETLGLWCSTTDAGLDYRPIDPPTADAWRRIMGLYNTT